MQEKIIPQYLKEAGYITGMAGKWHLNPNHGSKEWLKQHHLVTNQISKIAIPAKLQKPYFTDQRGFDYILEGYVNQYRSNYDIETGDRYAAKNIKVKGYRLDIQTQAAVTFIEKNQKQPFFFYLAYFAPHVPLDAPAKYLRRFPEDMPVRRRYALAMLSAMDDGVGRIRSKLKELELDDNTLIFFISDNGAPLKIKMKDIPISFKGGAWNGSMNKPFIGEKGMLTDGGIRVPYIMSWPAVLPKNKVYHKAVSTLDVTATALTIAGSRTSTNLDGVNLIPYLTDDNPDDPHEYLYWRFWSQAAVRKGTFKYLTFDQKEYLFDLSTQDHEMKNVIAQHPKLAMELKVKLQQWSLNLKNKGISFETRGGEKKWYDFYFKTKQ